MAKKKNPFEVLNADFEIVKELEGDTKQLKQYMKKQYKILMFYIHPDIHNGSPSSSKKSKEINNAKDELTRAEDLVFEKYIQEFLKQKEKKQKKKPQPPKPVVEPSHIKFDTVEPGKAQIASFVIRNDGGHYSDINIFISNSDSWVEIENYAPLNDSDELPLWVEIQAKGDQWDKSYSEVIIVRLDNEETQVRVTLRTKKKPVKEKRYIPKFMKETEGIPAGIAIATLMGMAIINTSLITPGRVMAILSGGFFIEVFFLTIFEKINNRYL